MAFLLLSTLVAMAECTSVFNWSSIHPTPSLNYHDCYDGFECARMQVPLDWSNPGQITNDSVAIAILTLPAKVPHTDPSFGGTVIYNAGGPGQAGTSDPNMMAYLQDLLDGDRHYELLTFDPRGVFRTTPSANCNPNPMTRALADTTRFAIGRISAGHDNLPDHLAFAQAESQLCEQNLPHILPYMSSASVARDLIEIVDRTDELRGRNRTAGNAEKSRIQYIGPSYGSALGQYLAAMFPERLGRIYLDGVIDIEDWLAGSARTWLSDNEATVNEFYRSCFDAGNACALRRPSDTDWTTIRQRVDSLLARLDEAPVPIVFGGSAALVTSSFVRLRIAQNLYIPVVTHPALAVELAGAVSGNYTAFYAGLGGSTDAPTTTPPATEPAPEVPLAYTWTLDAQTAVTCLDADPSASSRGLASYNEYLSFVEAQAPTGFQGTFPTVTFGCAGRHIQPAFAFNGPFTVPPVSQNSSNAPAAPILFGTPRFEPVTPSARRMTNSYPGSAAFLQEGSGHTIIFNQPSNCSRDIIRRYFDTGVVPTNGTVCEARCAPWQDCTPISQFDPTIGTGRLALNA